MQDEEYGKRRFSAAYVLNKEELGTIFEKAYTGHASKPRLIIQSVVMAVVGIISLVDYIAVQPRRGMSLFIAIAALVVGVAQWLIMPAFRWSSVRQQLAENTTIHLSVYEKGIGFGQGERMLIFPFDKCQLITEKDLLIVVVNHEFVGIPNRIISDDDRVFLMEWIPPFERTKKG